MAFEVPFLCYFQKLQLLSVKKLRINFCCIALFCYIYELKNVSQIFKILFQTGDINIFVFRGVFFSRYVQLKCSFSEAHFSRKAIEINVAKYSKKTPSLVQIGPLQSYS